MFNFEMVLFTHCFNIFPDRDDQIEFLFFNHFVFMFWSQMWMKSLAVIKHDSNIQIMKS